MSASAKGGSLGIDQLYLRARLGCFTRTETIPQQSWNLAANRWIRPADEYAGCGLLLETSEEMPSAEETFRMLRNAGERGLLAQLPAILVATAKASSLQDHTTSEQRERNRADQQAAIVQALNLYHPEAMVVFNVDFGHTDPQWVLPYGGTITLDGPARRITAHY
jgi:muramoyltetrapeptide carboxypeptidase LdcA involved in peptidoglycan recycling